MKIFENQVFFVFEKNIMMFLLHCWNNVILRGKHNENDDREALGLAGRCGLTGFKQIYWF
jgi:hypothetical protein